MKNYESLDGKTLKISNITEEVLNLTSYPINYKKYDLTIYYEKEVTAEDRLAKEKEIKELEASIAKRKALLNNENFTKKAPSNLVENEKEKLAQELEKLAKLKNE